MFLHNLHLDTDQLLIIKLLLKQKFTIQGQMKKIIGIMAPKEIQRMLKMCNIHKCAFDECYRVCGLQKNTPKK